MTKQLSRKHPGLNVSQLRAFVAVVDEGTFSAAARVLGVSQPAVTMQIKSLEEELGVTLLDRRYRRIDLTEEGQRFIKRARSVLTEIAQAREEIAEVSGVIAGPLLIAASTTPGDYLVPGHLRGFLSEHSSIDVSISIQDSSSVIRAVEEGRADIGITGMKAGKQSRFTPLSTDELIVIAHPHHPLSGARPLDLTDLADQPWVMRETGSGTRTIIERALPKRMASSGGLDVVVELGTGEAILNAVEGDLGIAIVSRYVADKALAAETVVELPLKDPIYRPFYLVLPGAEPTKAAQAFHDYMVEALS